MRFFRHPWILFASFVIVLFSVMVWLSVMLVHFDLSSVSARKRAMLEENVRLALWRMDSRLAGLIATENTRPVYEYDAFYPVESTYTRHFAEIRRGDVLMPSPLLISLPPGIRLHFSFDDTGRLSSPQVPEGNMRDLAEMSYVPSETIVSRSTDLAQAGRLVTRDGLRRDIEHLAQLEPARPVLEEEHYLTEPESPRLALMSRTQDAMQSSMSSQEYVARRRQVTDTIPAAAPEKLSGGISMKDMAFADADQARPGIDREDAAEPAPVFLAEGFHPLWIDENLFFARKAFVNGREIIQGFWVDWPEIERLLRDDIRDLFPEAELSPDPALMTAPGHNNGIGMRRLASIPVRLNPGFFTVSGISGWSPVRISLIVAWLCVFAAVGAAATLLHGVLALSDRRAAFVSAVTHELRTPLTTFRMYTEMLAEGMVPDADRQREYIDVLRIESERFGHLVDNVLLFARLEKTSADYHTKPVDLKTLLETVTPRLRERVFQAGMQWVMVPETNDVSAACIVRADLAAVERILFNLVDNACKYASNAANRQIIIDIIESKHSVGIRVSDFGAGIAVDVRRKLFTAFGKSAQDAARTAPGVGLGLALSRRLARKMGGDLRFDQTYSSGARFILVLKRGEPLS